MVCLVCNGETEVEGKAYCPGHELAFKNLREAYDTWTVAYGSVSIADFLQRIQNLNATGQKVVDIARFLLENPARWK